MDDRFAFILPVMQATFGVAAAMAGRWRVPSAWWWSGGFLGCAIAFAMPALPFGMPLACRAGTASAVFALAFFCFSQALSVHFGLRRDHVYLRSMIALASAGGSIWGALADNLRLHLVTSDLGCALLLAVPLLCSRETQRRTGDRALAIVSWLVVIDCMARVLAIRWLADGGLSAFADSLYAFYYQATGSLVGVIFAMAALASIMISVLTRYRDWATSDPLTGLLNRRGFDEALASRSQIERCAAAVILADIDHFKSVNDRFGHHLGDEVIALMATSALTHLPPDALAARFGGEEFVFYLPHSTPNTAIIFAEAVRREFALRAARLTGDSAPTRGSIAPSIAGATAA